ncbi:hypothetical protein PAMP_008164 [Pampus punctatissimus]
MNPSPQMEFRPQGAVMFSTIVVVNIIWWMVMIAAIGLGVTHLNRCTVQPSIPLYLLVMGVASILALSLTYTHSICDSGAVYILSSFCMTLLHIFSFGWFIAGTYWVYSVYPPNYTPGPAPYCQKTTFQFAFVVTTLVWVTLSLMFVCGGCFILLSCCCTVNARHRLSPNRSTFYGGTNDFADAAGDV